MKYIQLLWRDGKGLQGVIDAINNIREFFETLVKFVSSFFKSIYVALGILLQMIPKIMIWIATLPTWLLSFATITIIITAVYFVLGRQAGKSD